MRITGGFLSGRKIKPPLSLTTRPMMDRIRQALFNILRHHEWPSELGPVLENASVLDAFCGTGALAFEALSYGARWATLFDKEQQALLIAKENARDLGLEGTCEIISADTLRPPSPKTPARLTFLCPPYRKNLIPPSLSALAAKGWFREKSLIIGETAKNEPLELPSGFTVLLDRSYGDTTLFFIQK